MRGHARALSFEPGAVGSAVSPDLRQVPRHEARQRSRGRGSARGILPQGWGGTGVDQGQALAVVDPLGSSEPPQETAAQRTVRAQPPGDEGLSVEGELGSTLELYL